MKGFNPENIQPPKNLEGRVWLTFKEFGSIAGISESTVRTWRRRGLVKSRRFTPRCNMIHISEVGRLMRGELYEGRLQND